MERVRLATGPVAAYAEGGDPSGTPVVLLHGYADSHRFWEPVTPLLRGRLRVLAPTQRGHGDSDKPLEGYDPASLAGDVVAFLDALDEPEAVLVGHSSGGLVAQHAAVTAPDRVLGVVLVGAPPDLHGRTPPFAGVVASMNDPVSPADVRAVLGTLGGNLAVEPAWLEEMVGESAKLPARVWREALAALTAAPPPSVTSTHVPAVVVWGDADEVLPREGQEQLARSWSAELVVVPGAGHLLAWEQPAVVAGEIDRFVAALGAPGAAH